MFYLYEPSESLRRGAKRREMYLDNIPSPNVFELASLLQIAFRLLITEHADRLQFQASPVTKYLVWSGAGSRGCHYRCALPIHRSY